MGWDSAMQWDGVDLVGYEAVSLLFKLFINRESFHDLGCEQQVVSTKKQVVVLAIL